jgi:DNA-binding transcriptional ArsR family regulator
MELNRTFYALSDPTRRAIISRLSGGDVSILELASPFDMTLPAVSKHIRVLEKAGLLTRTKHGRVQYCRLNVNPLREAANWLAFYQQFWDAKLDSLADFLEENSD